jgi:uncharacterized lipoprotein YmbA
VIRTLTALALAALLAGCAAAPRESHYTLSSGDSAPPLSGGLPDVGITVVATGLAESVDRPQLVIRRSETRVDILEQQRWAEPLKSAIPRVVAANLARELGSARVTSQAQTPLGETAYRVALDVRRFDSMPGQGASIEVGWTLRRAADNRVRSGRSVVTEPSAPGYDALVAGHSRALAKVSREIAALAAEK